MEQQSSGLPSAPAQSGQVDVTFQFRRFDVQWHPEGEEPVSVLVMWARKQDPDHGNRLWEYWFEGAGLAGFVADLRAGTDGELEIWDQHGNAIAKPRPSHDWSWTGDPGKTVLSAGTVAAQSGVAHFVNPTGDTVLTVYFGAKGDRPTALQWYCGKGQVDIDHGTRLARHATFSHPADFTRWDAQAVPSP